MHVFSKNGERTLSKLTLSKLSKTSDVGLIERSVFYGIYGAVVMYWAMHTYCGGESTLLDWRFNRCSFTARDLEIRLYRHFVGVDPLFVLAIFDSQKYRMDELSGTVVRHM